MYLASKHPIVYLMTKRRSLSYKRSIVRTNFGVALLVLSYTLPHIHAEYEGEVRTFAEYIERLEAKNGLRFAVQYLKDARLAVLRTLTGHPLASVGRVELVNGWPTSLEPFRELLQTTEGCRFLLTVLTALRGVILPPVLDLTPIITPTKATLPPESELLEVARRLKVGPTEVGWSELHVSAKKGPLGHATLTSLNELRLLPPELIADIKLLGGEKLSNFIDGAVSCQVSRRADGSSLSLLEAWSVLFPTRSSTFRKLSYFPDKEGKTRVIAILDYWSQTALKPVHRTVSGLLAKLDSDFTFNQGSFRRNLPSTGPYYSYDLSNATDRMPLALQVFVLSLVIGRPRAESWGRILVSWPYASIGRGGASVPVSYAAGQPMGAYSSWPVMALTHHFIVQLAALRAGLPSFKGYALLGDDLVLTNHRVASLYLEILKSLDMPFSEAKSHVSEDTYEFAKRWISKGSEVTPFSVSGMIESAHSYAAYAAFIENQCGHGWAWSQEWDRDFIVRLHRLLHGPRAFTRRSVSMAKLVKMSKSLAFAKAGDDYIPLSEIAESFMPTFSHWGLLLEQRSNFTELQGVIRRIFLEAQCELLRHDVRKMTVEVGNASKMLMSRFTSCFPGLPVQRYFVALSRFVPGMVVANRLSASAFRSIVSGIIDAPADWVAAGRGRYHVIAGVYTLQAAKSRVLDEGRLVKSFLHCFAMWDRAGRPVFIDDKHSTSLFEEWRKVSPPGRWKGSGSQQASPTVIFFPSPVPVPPPPTSKK